MLSLITGSDLFNITECPHHCTCLSMSNGVRIKCQRDLAVDSVIRTIFPRSTVTLEIFNSKLPHLSASTFTSLSHLTKLESLQINRCGIKVIESGVFKHLKQLHTLKLEENKLKRILTYTFKGLQRLTYLDLHGNYLSDIQNYAFYGLRLSMLKLNRNVKLTYLSTLSFSGSKVKVLDCQYCKLNASTMQAFQPLAKNLSVLVMSNCVEQINITEHSLRGHNLNTLNLASCGIKNTRFLRHLCVTILILDENYLDNIRFDNYKCTPMVKELYLQYTSITTLSNDAFIHLTGLRILDIRYNKIRTMSSYLLSTFSVIPIVFIGFNPFHCNCEIRWVKTWASQITPFRINETFNDAWCHSPISLWRKRIHNLETFEMYCAQPEIIQVFHEHLANSDRHDRLVCIAKGDPTPAIQWETPDGLVASSQQDSSHQSVVYRTMDQITMSILSSKFKGRFTCKALNIQGISMKSLQVDDVRFTDGIQFVILVAVICSLACVCILTGLIHYTKNRCTESKCMQSQQEYEDDEEEDDEDDTS